MGRAQRISLEATLIQPGAVPLILASLLLFGAFSRTLDAKKHGVDKIAGQTTDNSANFVLVVDGTIKGSLLPNDHANVSWTNHFRTGVGPGVDFKGAYAQDYCPAWIGDTRKAISHIDTFTSQEACTGHTVNTDLNGSPFFGIRLR